ncbi:PucR family transcriptional regulator [Mycobacterium sp. 1274756.6]|uniref:PucR family transcriptional regulator n=1 Tax=Mycobacterium sp. 1274756.6 TaxID=1834076 RepID=UPI00080116A9|nr:PucR family transcriptional regulator [Mycobacterium sp. 1274756.6]OBJ71989.1 hypothetical protein A5643_00740 [Mycobacterium sp. 1274756.6]
MSASTSVASGIPPQMVQELLTAVQGMSLALAPQIAMTDRFYSDSPLLSGEELQRTCLANLTAMVEALAGDRPVCLEPAYAAGKLKAELGIPIASLLHAYRLAGRLIWEELAARVAAPDSPSMHHSLTRIWDVVDAYSVAAAETYRETENLLSRADAQLRTELVRTLFEESTSSGRILDALRSLGLPEVGLFVVARIEASEQGEPLLHSSLTGMLQVLGAHSVWDSQIDAHVGLLAASTPECIDRAAEKLTTVADSRVGFSTTFRTPYEISKAAAEAHLACRSAHRQSRRAIRFGEEPLAHLLVAQPDVSMQAAVQILGPLLTLPTADRKDLLEALGTWFECGGSAAAVAKKLHCHRNTVHYKMRKIRDLTGRDFTQPAHAAELYSAWLAIALLDE